MTEWVLFRHGAALPPAQAEALGVADAERPLTEQGRRRTALAARGLASLFRPERLLASPSRRAQETARLLAAAWAGSVAVETVPWLAPEAALETAFAHAQGGRWLLVGHEPGLSGLVARALCDGCTASMELKKAGAALVRFAQRPAPGRGELVWLLPPRVLRRLAS